MCGIIGYIGRRKAIPILLEGLKRLEYRGYDSAGVSYFHKDCLQIWRSEGKLSNLAGSLAGCIDCDTPIGLGHTRWATHGAPCERNAHPHCDCSGRISLVHNGIIENYYSLRERLKRRGHRFSSETDTEVLAHLIEEHLNGDLLSAVAKALREVEGSYAIGVLWSSNPHQIVAARNQSPLVIGSGEGEYFLASDVPAFLPWTNKAVFLDDGEMACLENGGIRVFSVKNGAAKDKQIHSIAWDAAMAEKAGFPHFMLKEIFEQPEAIRNTFRGRIDPVAGVVFLPEVNLADRQIQELHKVLFVACGTSYHAGLVAKYLLERWLRIPLEVELGSEFRYREPCIDEKTLTVPITQSGETADTLAGLRSARQLGAKIISICNVLGSTATRESDGTVYTHAGPEIGVASTKAFTSQLTALTLLSLFLAEKRGTVSTGRCREIIAELMQIPEVLLGKIAGMHQQIKQIAGILQDKTDFLYLGRNILFPVALEGALKLKEISYIHAEGYPAGEMKHGPIALIDSQLPVVALAPMDHVYEKMISNIEEVKSRKGIIIALGEEGDATLERLSEHFIGLPRVSWELSPILYTIPLQLLAYEIAVLRGCDVDQPRNLAKSVTVE